MVMKIILGLLTVMLLWVIVSTALKYHARNVLAKAVQISDRSTDQLLDIIMNLDFESKDIRECDRVNNAIDAYVKEIDRVKATIEILNLRFVSVVEITKASDHIKANSDKGLSHMQVALTELMESLENSKKHEEENGTKS